MNNSSYYYNLMQSIAASKAKLEKKRDLYQSVLDTIATLDTSISNSAKSMRLADSLFANGGYFVDGETVSSGALITNAEKLEELEMQLLSISSLTTDDIDEFEQKIKELENEYSVASSCYRTALLREEVEFVNE